MTYNFLPPMSHSFKKHHLKSWGLEIVNKYPLIYLELSETTLYYVGESLVKEDVVNLRYGFECEEGWAKIIDNLSSIGSELVTFLRANGHPSASIHGCICKEKFGTLRWQGDRTLPEPFASLWDAQVSYSEHQSAHFCEVTGGYGQARNMKEGKPAWVKVLCDEEAVKKGYDLKSKIYNHDND